MEETLLNHYQTQLDSQDTWGVNDLAEFFGVSHQTVRRRIEDGEITAKKKETETGYIWEVPAGEIKRNLAQSQTLQQYLTDKLKKQEDGSQIASQRSPNVNPDEGIIPNLLERIDRLQDKVESLREENGRLKAQNEHLEDENKDLRARLNEYIEPKALPAAAESGRKEVLDKVYNLSTVAGVIVQGWVEKEKNPEEEPAA